MTSPPPYPRCSHTVCSPFTAPESLSLPRSSLPWWRHLQMPSGRSPPHRPRATSPLSEKERLWHERSFRVFPSHARIAPPRCRRLENLRLKFNGTPHATFVEPIRGPVCLEPCVGAASRPLAIVAALRAAPRTCQDLSRPVNFSLELFSKLLRLRL